MTDSQKMSTFNWHLTWNLTKNHLKAYFIVNPHSAGGKTGSQIQRLRDVIKQQVEYFSIGETTEPGHATVLTREAIHEGYAHIFSVGGDGTFHEVLNGYLHHDKPLNPEVKLSLLPAGTGGDLRRSIGLPRQLEQALKQILQSSVRQIDCGKCECLSFNGTPKTEYFHNVCSFGLTDLAAEKVNTTLALKKLGGKAAYFFAGIQAIAQHKPPKVTIQVDHEDLGMYSINVMAIANGNYFGGGMKIAPYAKLNDGLLDILLFTDLNRAELLAYNGLIYSGNHVKLNKVKQLTGKEISVSSENSPIRVEADGEILGMLPAQFTILPKAIRFQ